MKKNILKYLPILISAPSIIIGAIAMHLNGISPFIYLQNIIYLIIAGLISYFVIRRKQIIHENTAVILTIISIIILLLAFIDSGIEGVHRWISIGPINLYSSAIVVPILIICFGKMLQNKSWLLLSFSAICISIILALQPDASMVAAFSLPMMILLWKNSNHFFRFFILALLSCLIIYSWIFLDRLAPVSYVEGILNLVANNGIIWLILGVISLGLLPLPFIFFPPQGYKLLSRCIGIYYIVILISCVFGNFPVPLMGYGVSPIIGYFISITWLANAKINFSYLR